MDPTCVLSRCGHILVLQLCKLHFLRFVHLSIGRRYITIIVFAVIRVISAVFLKAHGRLAWGGLTISTRMCWLVDSTIALLTTVLHYPFSNMYSYLNSSLVYINAYSLNGNMWGRECPKLFFSMEGGIPHRDTPGTFLFLI